MSIFRLHALILLCAVFCLLTCALPLRADSILDLVSFTDPDGDLVTLEIDLDAAGNSIYTLLPPDSDQQTTTYELTNDLMYLILDLGGDSSEIAELFQPGAVFAQYVNPGDITPVSQQDEVDADTPEPATLIIPGVCLLLLVCYALARKRVRAPKRHGPI